MLKRFRHDDLDVWFIYEQHLLQTERPEKARNVLVLSRFAQLEFKFGDMEQSKTIFESVLNSFPKKTDVWTVYIDLLTKSGRIDDARKLLERVTALELSTHKIRLFYRKWMNLEEKYGDENRLDNIFAMRMKQFRKDLA
ncbi:unnamed protein product [Thelazia callipaeda]|uniref:TPR_REGION domain-containing protein n=1 Tax=Thelazia callipaeda TaxID=103827 RepID=A0A0N5CTW5_THECL|nr:unnamed protein product [Thelazia callipaeda]